MKNILEFLSTAEKLHYEKRTLELGNGEKQSVSSHSWMMAIMAMIFAPRLKTPVDLNKVLKLCILHDLAESKAHDIPVHELMKNSELGKNKIESELQVMKELCNLLPEFKIGSDIMSLWTEYEERKTPEARFVKLLDLLDVVVQLICSKSLESWKNYDNGAYPKLYFSEKYQNMFKEEPVIYEVFKVIQEKVEKRLYDEFKLTPADFKD